MKMRVNATVKYREKFRPFAPAIIDIEGNNYFENFQDSRFMEKTLKIKEIRYQLLHIKMGLVDCKQFQKKILNSIILLKNLKISLL